MWLGDITRLYPISLYAYGLDERLLQRSYLGGSRCVPTNWPHYEVRAPARHWALSVGFPPNEHGVQHTF